MLKPSVVIARGVLYSLLTAVVATPLHATDLMDVYRQSLENDPLFKAA